MATPTPPPAAAPRARLRWAVGALACLCGALIWPARATDIYRAELADGTYLYTDAPSGQGFRPFLLDKKPLPHRSKVNARSFPLLDTFDDEILAASERYGVPPELIKAVCLAESGMNPRALSRAGAQGLMQLMPATARGLGVADPWDPVQNIDGGTRYLRSLMQRFPRLDHAVAGYNAGPRNVEKHRGIPPFQETQHYVVRVLDLYDHLRDNRPVVPEDLAAYGAGQ